MYLVFPGFTPKLCAFRISTSIVPSLLPGMPFLAPAPAPHTLSTLTSPLKETSGADPQDSLSPHTPLCGHRAVRIPPEMRLGLVLAFIMSVRQSVLRDFRLSEGQPGGMLTSALPPWALPGA